MTKDNHLVFSATVLEVLPNRQCRLTVDSDPSQRKIIGIFKSGIDKRKTRISRGDKVTVEFSEYDLDRCRVIAKL
jgi:translation initiation factor IF-1